MGRKKNPAITEQYAINWLKSAPSLDWEFYRLGYFINLAALSGITLYFLGSLNMMDKIFTFIISGKVMGTDYILKFNDVCWISAGIVAILLAKSVFNFLKVAKNRNKIKLQIKEAYPLSLKVRVTA